MNAVSGMAFGVALLLAEHCTWEVKFGNDFLPLSMQKNQAMKKIASNEAIFFCAISEKRHTVLDKKATLYILTYFVFYVTIIFNPKNECSVTERM